MPTDHSITPEEIVEIRKRWGDSQSAFAARLGITRHSTVSEWERGVKSPSPPVVLLIRYLDAEHRARQRVS